MKIKEKNSKINKKPASRRKPITKHSQQYYHARDQVDRRKFYSAREALELIPKISRENFPAAVELHLSYASVKGKVVAPEHFILGKVKDKTEDLLAGLEKQLVAVKKKISKIVVCSTMSPGIKITLPDNRLKSRRKLTRNK